MSEVPGDRQVQEGRNAGPGAVLLAERRQQNLSLGDVSRQLKLSVRQVEALERDDFAGFQSPVFVHGFLRNYAKLLALDPAPLIQAADRMMAPSAPPPHEASTAAHAPAAMARPRSKWPMAAVAAVVVAGVALLALYPRGASKPKPVPEGAPVAHLAVAPQEGKPPAARVPERTGAGKPPAERAAKAPAARPAVPEPETGTQEQADKESAEATTGEATVNDTDAAETQPVDPAALVTLRMVFDEESWVEVKDRHGTTVFGQLNAAGTRRFAKGEPPLTVVVGNAAGVKLFLGDRNIDLAPHTRVDVARLTVE